MWRWVRVLKSGALVAFVLPWLTVSCSGQKITSASGLNLLSGQMSVTNPANGSSEAVNGSPSLLICLAALAIVVGLIYAFKSRDGSGQAAPIVFGTSSGALALIFLGTMGINGSTISAQAAARGQGGGWGAEMANAMIKVDYAFGFWLTALALAASGVIAWMIWQGKSRADVGALGQKLAHLSANMGATGDTSYWDGMVDKNDPDALQEYLIRYPQGRFSELARQKLARVGIEPLTPAVAAPVAAEPPPEKVAAVQLRTCPRCGTRYPGDTKFCTADGEALV